MRSKYKRFIAANVIALVGFIGTAQAEQCAFGGLCSYKISGDSSRTIQFINIPAGKSPCAFYIDAGSGQTDLRNPTYSSGVSFSVSNGKPQLPTTGAVISSNAGGWFTLEFKNHTTLTPAWIHVGCYPGSQH